MQVIEPTAPQIESRSPERACSCRRCKTFGRVADRAMRNTSTPCRATDTQEIYDWAPKVEAALQKIPMLTEVNLDQQQKGLESDLVIDRNTAARLGLSVAQIDNTLYDAFGQRQVSVIYATQNQYHVMMEVAPEYWQNPEILHDIYVSTSGGPVSGTNSTNALAGTVTAASSDNNAATLVTNNAATAASNNASTTVGNTAATRVTNFATSTTVNNAVTKTTASTSAVQSRVIPPATWPTILSPIPVVARHRLVRRSRPLPKPWCRSRPSAIYQPATPRSRSITRACSSPRRFLSTWRLASR